MNCIIRKAENEDFADVYDLICELVGSPVGGMSSNALEKIYQTNLLSDIKRQYVAESSGEIVGFISLTFDMRLSEAGKVAVIDELVVKKNLQNNGIGSVLVEYAIGLAKKPISVWLRLQPIFTARMPIVFMRGINLSETVIGLALMLGRSNRNEKKITC